MKYKELKRENKELSQKLNMANKTVHDLMQEVDLIREKAISATNKQHKQHESQMQVAENEIKRLNVIIDFLYTRGRE